MKLKNQKGFTLIELILVAAIMGLIMVMIVGFSQQRTNEMKRNRASLQMQQILNAGLAFYVANGRWPKAHWGEDSFFKYYLSNNTYGLKNPFNGSYGFDYTYDSVKAPSPNNPTGLFYVTMNTGSNADALVVAGTVPLGYVNDYAGTRSSDPPKQSAVCQNTPTNPACTFVVASVNIPGQNLNNANAVTFAGLYHPDACVPAPQCPTYIDNTGTQQTMKAQIFVVPTSVSGIYDQTGNTPNLYPINSFTAFALPNNGNPILGGTGMPKCTGGGTSNCQTASDINASLSYWRVCLQIGTEKGPVAYDATTNPSWAQNVWVMAFTRCQVSGEPAGSGTSVYQQY